MLVCKECGAGFDDIGKYFSGDGEQMQCCRNCGEVNSFREAKPQTISKYDVAREVLSSVVSLNRYINAVGIKYAHDDICNALGGLEELLTTMAASDDLIDLYKRLEGIDTNAKANEFLDYFEEELEMYA